MLVPAVFFCAFFYLRLLLNGHLCGREIRRQGDSQETGMVKDISEHARSIVRGIITPVITDFISAIYHQHQPPLRVVANLA